LAKHFLTNKKTGNVFVPSNSKSSKLRGNVVPSGKVTKRKTKLKQYNILSSHFHNHGTEFPDKVVSLWISPEGDFLSYGYDPDSKYGYLSDDHYGTTTELADALKIKLDRWDTHSVYGKKIWIDNPVAHDDNVNELLRKTGLVRIQNHRANPHESFNFKRDIVEVEVATPLTVGQLRTLRKMEKDTGLTLNFNVGKKGDFESGETFRELVRTNNKAFGVRDD